MSDTEKKEKSPKRAKTPAKKPVVAKLTLKTWHDYLNSETPKAERLEFLKANPKILFSNPMAERPRSI